MTGQVLLRRQHVLATITKRSVWHDRVRIPRQVVTLLYCAIACTVQHYNTASSTVIVQFYHDTMGCDVLGGYGYIAWSRRRSRTTPAALNTTNQTHNKSHARLTAPTHAHIHEKVYLYHTQRFRMQGIPRSIPSNNSSTATTTTGTWRSTALAAVAFFLAHFY